MPLFPKRINFEPGPVIPELQGRIASLDGLRAISISMVLLAHATLTCGFNYTLPDWLRWVFNGPLGVRVFFVISGFIITLLLLKEERQHGAFSAKNFYIRRALRILPVYFVFLLTVVLVNRAYDLQIDRTNFIAAFTFTTGWWRDGHELLGHTWSLSVEEQFYLLWPAFLIFVRSPKARVVGLVIFIAAFPLFRIAFYLTPLRDIRPFVIVTQGDALLYGGLLAIGLFYYGEKIRAWFVTNVFLVRVGCIAVIAISNAVQLQMMLGFLTIPFSNGVEGLAIALLMGTLILKKDVVHRVLNTRVFVFLGTISYSWYLWQQLFLNKCDMYFHHTWFHFPINIALSFVAAVVSYFVVERTFLKLRMRLFKDRPGIVGPSR